MPRAKKINPKLNTEMSVIDEIFLENDDRLRTTRLEQDGLSERISKLEYRLKEENLHKDPNRSLFHVSSGLELEATSDDIRRELFELNRQKTEIDNQINALENRLEGLHKVRKILYKLDEPASEEIVEEKKETGSVVVLPDITSILHDECIQNVASAIGKLEMSERLLDFDPSRARLEILSVEEILKGAISSLREAIYEVRPMTLSDIGFWESVEESLNKIKQSSGVQVRLDVSDDASGFDPEPDAAAAFFKIIQEAFFETLNHGEVSRVVVTADKDDSEISVSIKDDGNVSSTDSSLSVIRKKVNVANGKMENVSKKRGNEIIITLPFIGGNI